MTSIKAVLVGKTGNGKSSTGNTILQRIMFHEASDITDGTQIFELKSTKFDEKFEIKIFDSPGLQSLRLEEQKRKGAIRREMDRLMDLAQIVHVFIIVFSYDCQNTDEVKETVKELKKILGETFLRNNGIIVLTHGDSCERIASEKNISCEKAFEEWCKHAGKDFRALKSEVADRVLLVNNTGDFHVSSTRMKSSQDLRNMIKQMYQDVKPFTEREYEKLNPTCILM